MITRILQIKHTFVAANKLLQTSTNLDNTNIILVQDSQTSVHDAKNILVTQEFNALLKYQSYNMT